ncbi:Cleavage and polyadenylation specificity factor CPSF30 [Apostasia shenzhenica]|uniref:YTH domain-containing family protein n=1 Tax=Apostasia shenzhenica TaxID=1088818 RepID=A0A2I0A548_9ASPA|nr:Cleavage and polyadenylation specificity factor CPSF30 [Apostasia shenzhenica]
MATTLTGPDRIDAMEPLNLSALDAIENSSSIENIKDESHSCKDDKTVDSNVSHDSNAMDPLQDAVLESLDTSVDGGTGPPYPSNIYAPQAQTLVYGGYENASGKWEEYPHQFTSAPGVEAGSTGIYNEHQSVMFHTGYGYNPQMPYGPYSPVTTPLPSAGGEGHLYSPQQFPFTGPYYQQPAPPNIPYLHSPTPMSQADLSMLVDQQDWLKTPDGTGSLTPLLSPAASPQPIGAIGSFGQGVIPLSSGMRLVREIAMQKSMGLALSLEAWEWRRESYLGTQQQTAFYGFSPSMNSYDQGYFQSGLYHPGNNFGGSISSFGNSSRSLIAVDKGRRRGKGFSSMYNSYNDYLNEQNRGPRATRPKNAKAEQGLSADRKSSSGNPGINREVYNQPDFVVDYKHARFFIIKSYSEDNVHKSIKYGVWASTANGNKKLDAAYHEAKEKGDSCPVFLFFSVNASAHFCGVAEMTGPVDFDKSVDYWQQDKWSGQFPVKWHIIKDLPNSLFRHIILENNDNKPVTNSRDTQEVKLEQGLEMLGIFKKNDSDVSILDDFDFYEDRQRAMQERKARQQQHYHHQQSNLVVNGVPNPASRTGELLNQISKNFAQVVRIEKINNEDASIGRSNPSTANSEDNRKSETSTAGEKNVPPSI